MRVLHIIGLTGGMASGKSSVVSILKALNYPVIEADLLARAVVEKGERAHQELQQAFPDCFNGLGDLDRRALARIIHQDDRAREQVNRITHPEILNQLEKQIQAYEEKGVSLLFVDLPLLYEVGMEDRFHEVWVVYVEEEVQVQRLMERDAIQRGEAIFCLSSQLPMEEKALRAQRLIKNTGTKEDLKGEVQRCLGDFFREPEG